MKEERKTSFFSMRISATHILYWLLITIIINIFLFCVCPGRVSDEAMANISFASAIVSIVLALVSIVYSMQSGFSSSSQMEGVREIEGNIQKELGKFEELRQTISQSLDPINTTVRNIQKTAGDIQKAQDDMKKNIEGLFNPVTVEISDAKELGKKKDITLNHIMIVSLYAAARSFETTMDLPFHIFASYVGYQSHYSEGMLEGWAAIDEGLTIEKGSNPTRRKVTKYDCNIFGTADELRGKAISNPNVRMGRDFIEALDDYFSDIKNQQSKDSIG